MASIHVGTQSPMTTHAVAAPPKEPPEARAFFAAVHRPPLGVNMGTREGHVWTMLCDMKEATPELAILIHLRQAGCTETQAAMIMSSWIRNGHVVAASDLWDHWLAERVFSSHYHAVCRLDMDADLPYEMPEAARRVDPLAHLVHRALNCMEWVSRQRLRDIKTELWVSPITHWISRNADHVLAFLVHCGAV